MLKRVNYLIFIIIGGCTYGQIRLYNSTINTSGDSGMLQICDATGHWTAVCDYSWGCNEAVVACKQLGYNSPCELYRMMLN